MTSMMPKSASPASDHAISTMDGFRLHPGHLDRAAQAHLRDAVRDVVKAAPLFQPRMPKTGKPLSVRMTNCGTFGWVADIEGYRYTETHPDTGAPWPAIPPAILEIWEDLADYSAPPEACLVNWYGPGARMGLHQDRDEAASNAPVLSISLGDTALFRLGGSTRKDPTRSLKLASGDVMLLAGEARHFFHGVDRIHPGTSTLLAVPGRINLTLRRVTVPNDV